MCGIFGCYSSDLNNLTNVQKNLNYMSKKLHHRGPDDVGIEIYENSKYLLGFGHTRLSIIDLTDAGHQPMVTDCGRFSIVYNGEIYNYKEIRMSLESLGETFTSSSDTEVLLKAWKIYGKTCLNLFVGMFSFAIYDHFEHTLTLIRDAFGIKPLFFVHNGVNITFSSEILPLLRLSTKNKKELINKQRVYDYLVYLAQDHDVETFFNDVSQVKPGSIVTFDLRSNNIISNERWWKPSIDQSFKGSINDAACSLRQLFLESIKLHMRSDVPVGVALSGGLDSSAIACAIRYVFPDIELHSFSYISNDKLFSEEEWIDKVNEHVGAISHKVSINENEIVDEINDLVKTQGEPFCSTSMYAQYKVFKLAKENGIKVLLEGQGADELLAGYNGYPGPRMKSLLEQYKFRDLVDFIVNWPKWPNRSKLQHLISLVGQMSNDKFYKLGRKVLSFKNKPSYINVNMLNRLSINITNYRPGKCKEELTTSRSDYGRKLSKYLLNEITNGGLTPLLRYGDRNAMRFSIENRVPFLTIPIAEFLLSLPEEYLISNNGETKSVFRLAMRGIVPDEILDRKDKIGFVTPMHSWVENINNLRLKEKVMHDYDLFVDSDSLEKKLNSSIKKGTFGAEEWRLMNLDIWLNILDDYHNAE